MRNPKFKDHIHPIVVEEDKLILSSEFGQQLLTGRSLIHVAKHLNGDKSVDDIIQHLNGVVDIQQVLYVLSVLEEKKYIFEARNTLSVAESAFWSSLGVEEAVVHKNKKEARVRIYTYGTAESSNFIRQMDAGGLSVVQEAENIAVILTDDYLQDGVPEKARDLWYQNIPFLICKPNGIEVWLGPIFIPGKTACFDCLMQRLIANRDVEVYLRETGKINTPLVAASSLPSTIDTSLSTALTELLKFIVLGNNEQFENKIMSIHYGTMETNKHVVVRRPQCRVCGTSDTDRMPVRIEFQSSPKSFIDGGHRSVTAEETYHRFKHLISPITGIVNKLERITNGDDVLQHVFISGQNMAIKTNTLQTLRKNLRSNSCGKGVTEIQAKVSAIGEAIERYSGVYRGDEPRRLTSFKALGAMAIHPNDCMLFSQKQVADMKLWNDRESFFNIVPLPLDENAFIEWCPLWSVTRNEVVYLPAAYCYYSHPDNGGEHFFCAPDSNGCAAGNTLEEAVLQGFLELIERDSVAIWWYNRLKRPELDLESFNDDYAIKLRDYHKSRNRDMWVLDLTGDSGIPTFIAISARNDRNIFQDIVFAPAAHLDPSIALRRALTELNQMMPSMDESLPPGQYRYDDPETVHWWQTANLENQPYLSPDMQCPKRTVESFRVPRFTDIKDDLDYCVEIVKEMGLEMHILDQTRPDIGLYVVKVVVPGLRHFWARYADGRIYDVPVKMGWLPASLNESELNPISIFI
ncbi:TOMM precursor leader peptide-binding protein [Chryseobacterium sp. MYb264]|uniref:TOMM precursor leader peptide-binding protein n=1 Tax=Chryseobacterium sp. MYb264 TaxID=2745153 RepID=UPI002E1502AC|nr:TOMM precursor leader peptide-binding protein [Chryseobacterium sp. MYb264]